ncbi:MAG: hypothetical protein Kow0070_03740 [Anaerolineales bacterium]
MARMRFTGAGALDSEVVQAVITNANSTSIEKIRFMRAIIPFTNSDFSFDSMVSL